MSCFDGVFGGASDAKEEELKKQMKKLQQDIQESKAKLAAAKKERKQFEQDASAKEKEAIEVRAKVRAKQALSSHVAATKEATEGSCCFGGGAPEREKAMKNQVQKLRDELVASQEQVSQLKVEAHSAQKSVAKATKQVEQAKPAPKGESKSELVAERTLSFNSFAKEVNAFRGETPANQRQLKGAIVDLLKRLDAVEANVREEEKLTKQVQKEAKQHEQTVERLQAPANTNLFSFMSSGQSNQYAMFREQTPAKQREMKGELLQLLQDLEGIQVEKSEHEVVKDLSEKKLTNLRKRTGDADQAASKNSGFAFQN